MSEPMAVDEDKVLASLQALRVQGAQRADPAGFHHLEVLWQRLQAQSGPVRRILVERLRATLADYEARVAQARACIGHVGAGAGAGAGASGAPESASRWSRAAAASVPAASTPLSELNRYIQGRVREEGAQAGAGAGAGTGAASLAEMKSVRRFSEVWSRIAAEEQVSQALGRGPENAGPLNSHRLVLRSLALMRTLSPAYLQRFLAQADALLWLEQANQKVALGEAAKPARRGRLRK